MFSGMISSFLSKTGPSDWVMYGVAFVLCVHYGMPQRSKATGTVGEPTQAVRTQRKTLRTVATCNPLTTELHRCLAEFTDDTGRRPCLSFLRGLGMAGVLSLEHCMEALDALSAQNDVRGVYAVIALATKHGLSLESDVLMRIIACLCDSGADVAAVDLYKYVMKSSACDYYFDMAALERLIRSAGRARMFRDLEEIFAHAVKVETPSVDAYALAIHAHGDRGAVNACIDLYDNLLNNVDQMEQAEDSEEIDVSPAWNSLVASLTRNGFAQRAVDLYKSRKGMTVAAPVARALNAVTPESFRVPHFNHRYPSGRDRRQRMKCRAMTA